MRRTDPKQRPLPLAIALVLGLVAGCHKLLGEFSVSDEPVPSTPSTLCTTGSHRCVGPWLYECAEGQDAWREAAACQTAAHCDSRRGRCLDCVPETHRCNGVRLEVCSSEGVWTLLEDCASADQCNLNSDSCRPCTPGEFQCNEAKLLTCSSSETWMEIQECQNAAACAVADGERSGECKTPACTSMGQYQCNGSHLVRCTPSGNRLFEVEDCETPELCDVNAIASDVAQGLLGSCLTKCVPSTLRCNGATLETCDAASGRWQASATCPSPSECSVSAGGCQACTPGAKECNDGSLRRCGAAGWEVEADCGHSQFCDANQGCLEPGCPVANQTACRSDGLYRCLPDQSQWDLVTACMGDLCNANDGKCDTATCAPNETRCAGNDFESCAAGQRSWQTEATCSDGSCGSDGCEAAACTEDAYRCNDIYLERCDAGRWQRSDRCATRELCDADAKLCAPPQCAIGDYECLGQNLRGCTNERKWEDLLDCSSEGLTCNADLGSCI